MLRLSKRRTVLDIIEIGIVTASVILPQLYLEITGVNLDWRTFVFALVIPIILAFLFFWWVVGESSSMHSWLTYGR